MFECPVYFLAFEIIRWDWCFVSWQGVSLILEVSSPFERLPSLASLMEVSCFQL